VYQGAPSVVLNYFENLGFQKEPNENAADFMLDVIAGTIPRDNDPSFSPVQLPGLWLEGGAAFADSVAGDVAARNPTVVIDTSWRNEAAMAARDYFSENGIDVSSPLDESTIATFLESAGLPHDDATLAGSLSALTAMSGKNNVPTVQTLVDFLLAEATAKAALGPATTMRRNFPDLGLQALDPDGTEAASHKRCLSRGGNRSLPSFALAYVYLVHRCFIEAVRGWQSTTAFVIIAVLVSIVVSFAKGADPYPNILTPSPYLFASTYYNFMLVFGMIMGKIRPAVLTCDSP
jgi:hypothetical protein